MEKTLNYITPDLEECPIEFSEEAAILADVSIIEAIIDVVIDVVVEVVVTVQAFPV